MRPGVSLNRLLGMLPKPLPDVHGIRYDAHGEFWLLTYTADEVLQAVQAVSRWAMNPDLKFNWYDAGLVHARIKASLDECKGKQP